MATCGLCGLEWEPKTPAARCPVCDLKGELRSLQLKHAELLGKRSREMSAETMRICAEITGKRA